MKTNYIVTFYTPETCNVSMPTIKQLSEIFKEPEQDVDHNTPPVLIGHCYGAICSHEEEKQLIPVTLDSPIPLVYFPNDPQGYQDGLSEITKEVRHKLKTIQEKHNEENSSETDSTADREHREAS